MDELKLIHRCILKDKSAWDEFIQRYSRLIYSFIYTILRQKNLSFEPSLVDDIFQDILLHLIKDDFKKLSQFKARSSFTGWLKVVVINFVRDYLRKKSLTCVSLEETLDTAGELTLKDTLKDEDGPLADEVILKKEELENLSECISELNSQDRFFVEMHIYRGMALGELKGILRISRSAVDMRKQRLIKRLKECFQKKGFRLEN